MNSKSTNVDKGKLFIKYKHYGIANKVIKKKWYRLINFGKNRVKLKGVLGGLNFLNKIDIDESNKLLTMAQNILFKNQEFLILGREYRELKGVIYKLVQKRIQLNRIIFMLKSKGKAWKSSKLVLLHWYTNY